MSKKSAAGIIGALLITGVVAGVYKYLKDYGGAKVDKEKINSFKTDSAKVRSAAERAYTAIKDKDDSSSVKEAVGDLAKAAGETAFSAGDVAFSAGSSAIDAAKDVKSKFDADPKAFSKEVAGNLKDMKENIAAKASDYGKELKNKAQETVDKVKDIFSQDQASEEAGEESSESQDEAEKANEGSETTEESEAKEEAGARKEAGLDEASKEEEPEASEETGEKEESDTPLETSESDSEESTKRSYIEITGDED